MENTNEAKKQEIEKVKTTLDYELSKALHLYQRWRDELDSYIISKAILGGNSK